MPAGRLEAAALGLEGAAGGVSMEDDNVDGVVVVLVVLLLMLDALRIRLGLVRERGAGAVPPRWNSKPRVYIGYVVGLVSCPPE